MNFKEYEEKIKEFDVYPRTEYQQMYYCLGMCGEGGEVAEKIKKLFRDRNGKFDAEWVKELEKEIGDVLWYLGRLASSFGTSLDTCAVSNIQKLESRKARNLLHGEGDNR